MALTPDSNVQIIVLGVHRIPHQIYRKQHSIVGDMVDQSLISLWHLSMCWWLKQ